MTLHTIIHFAAIFVIAYGFTLCLFGGTILLTDLFLDWYQQFKQARKDKAAKVAAPLANEQRNKEGKA